MRNLKRSRTSLLRDLESSTPITPFLPVETCSICGEGVEQMLMLRGVCYGCFRDNLPVVFSVVFSIDELLIKQAAARVGATAVIVRDGSDLDSDADAWLNSAGAIVYRAEPPADLGTHVIISGGEVLDLSKGSTPEWWDGIKEEPYE